MNFAIAPSLYDNVIELHNKYAMHNGKGFLN